MKRGNSRKKDKIYYSVLNDMQNFNKQQESEIEPSGSH